MTIQEWLFKATKQLSERGSSSPRLDALLILEESLEQSRANILSNSKSELTKTNELKIESLLDRRLEGQPMAYILGYKEFYGIKFRVTPDVLVPRPETESLVEYALKNIPNKGNVLEIGTGSGCIAISLALNRSDINLLATDVSATALKIAKANAKTLDAKIEFRQADLFEGISEHFDVILANLPYVPENARRPIELNFEPSISLFGGSDGLDYYQRFLKHLPDYIDYADPESKSFALVEFSPTQFKAFRNELWNNTKPITEYIYRLDSPYN